MNAQLACTPLAILAASFAPERCLSSEPTSQGLPRPMAPLAIRAYTATTALGRGLSAQRQALQQAS